MWRFATKAYGQATNRLRKVSREGLYLPVNWTHAALSWLVVIALLQSAVLPLNHSSHTVFYSGAISAELEKTRIALGASVEEFKGFICHEADRSGPRAPSDHGRLPGKNSCPVCQSFQHLAFGLPPAAYIGTLFNRQPAVIHLLPPAPVFSSRTVRSGNPRAPPASIEARIV